ncbi:acyl-CoA dehydrogenase family protein [Aquibium sp. ELW1220]|uniref:acyl-CoA dehydrogenase family protein n=1 Tax=Aquibium sp. ELW1220 TaxID=2976766 RepID=UPI0025AF01F7|nr:acyl-CoA dehydrogenase family protein [Aquibium sp. ELW1220]MDN2583313.1 acyl-CoA/acyl-ACP dehydrogenase [Aquibium sp. ELW1220]
MDLQLSPDQIFMRDEARRLLAERSGSEQLRRAIGAGGFDAALWSTIGGELAWCAVAVPEEAGGLGLGAPELALLAEECGRRLAPVPFWSSACLAAPLVAALGAGEAGAALLGRIAAGEAAACAWPGIGGADPLCGTIPVARRAGGGWTVSATIAAVLDASSAAFFLVPASADGGLGLFAVERPAAAVEPLEGIDLMRPAARLVLDGAAASRIDSAGFSARDFDDALMTARLAEAAEQVGAAQGALDLTLAYVAERVQFGRTIASFQAVKHRCAALLVEISEARSLVHGAARSLDPLEVAAAGVLATQALFRAAEEAIQLHGGVGNTWEYDPHLYLRRAQATAAVFGSTDEKLAIIADALLGDAA